MFVGSITEIPRFVGEISKKRLAQDFIMLKIMDHRCSWP
jgi:hypothetical protein